MSDVINVINKDISDVIESCIHDSFIIDYGIITKVYDDEKSSNNNVLQVQVGACLSKEDFITFHCILCSLCSNNMNIKVDPKVGDRVIVFYPRRFNDEMLNRDLLATPVNGANLGYMYNKGLAFLASQYVDDKVSEANSIHIDNENITLNTNKKTTLNINGAQIIIATDGEITIKSASSKSINITDSKVNINNGNLEVSI